MPILICSILSVVLYLCAAGFAAYQLRHKTQRFAGPKKACFFAGLIVHSIVIGITSVSTSGTLLQGPNILMLAAWALAVIFAFFEIVVNEPYGYGAFIIPVVVLMMMTAEFMSVFANGTALYNRVFYEWPLLVGHIACFFVAIACFVISGVASGMLLYQQKLMKSKKKNPLGMQLPALSALKKIAGRAVCVGMPFLTIGMLLGYVRYAVLWGLVVDIGCAGSLGYLIPRIALTVGVFAAYCVYLCLIYLWPGRASSKTTSWLSIAAAISTVVLAVISSTSVM